MAVQFSIEYTESISRKKLVVKDKWLDIFDLITFFIGGVFFIICLILTFVEADLKSPNDRGIAFTILPLACLSAIIALYKKANEKRLLVIQTGLTKTAVRDHIKKMVREWGWKIQADNSNYLQAKTGFNIRWGKQVTILYAGDKIYLNVMSDTPFVRMPVFFSDKSIKRDIEKSL